TTLFRSPRALEELVAHRVDDVPRDGGGGDGVAGERAVREVHALAGEPLRWPVQRQAIGELVDDDLAHELVAEDATGDDEVGALGGEAAAVRVLEADPRLHHGAEHVEVA